MLDVWRYMNNEGFSCHERSTRNRCVWPSVCADVALIGIHSRDIGDVEGIIAKLERNHGMFKGCDMLIYFIDNKVPWKTFEIMSIASTVTQYEFADEAVRLLHTHLRRRHDLVARRGVYVTIDRILTESLDRITVPEDKDTLGSKINRTVSVLEKHLPDSDVDTVIKILKLLLQMRNFGIHLGDPAFKKRKDAWDAVRDEMIRRGYHMDRGHDPNRPKSEADEQDYHDNMKDLLVPTYNINDWLDAYARVVGIP